MIPILEIRATARKKGVPESTVERDYAQNWLLFGVKKHHFSLHLHIMAKQYCQHFLLN